MNMAKKIKIFTFARFQAQLFGLMGIIAGIIYSIGGFIVDLLVSLNWITSAETQGLSYGTALAFLSLLGMPIVFALIGYITGLIEAVLYNFFSRWLGGSEIDFFK